MDLGSHIFGHKVTLFSPLAKDEVRQRIKASTALGISPVVGGVTGGFWFGRLRLAWSVPMFDNGLRPVFVGQLSESAAGTVIAGSYGASGLLRAIFAIWYALLIGILCAGLMPLFEPEPNDGVNTELVMAVLPMALFPLAMHFGFNRSADTHFAEILAHLDTVAQARPQPGYGKI